MTEWIVVAGAAQAKVFKHHRGQLHWLYNLENPMGRPHEREFHSDRPGMGRARYAFGTAAHSYTSHKSALEQSRDNFARSLATHLAKAWRARRFERLTIVAEPHFFGRLRGHLGPLYNKISPRHIGKGLAGATTLRLQRMLAI